MSFVILVSASCNDQERFLVNKSSASPVYLIRSNEEVPDNIQQLLALTKKVLGFPFEAPFLLDVELFRNKTDLGTISVQCSNDSSEFMKQMSLLSPINVSAVLYGCDLHTGESTKMYVVNDVDMNESTRMEFQANYSAINSPMSHICHCSEAVDYFIRHCDHASEKDHGVEPQEVSILEPKAVIVVFLFVVFLVAAFVAKSMDRNNDC